MGTVFQRPDLSGFLLHKASGERRQGGGACRWAVWVLFGLRAAGAVAAAAQTPAAVYQQAQARFDADDLSGASSLLERMPGNGLTDRERADIANLRGAIALRQHHYDKAKEEFAAAASKDPHLWAARYNEAEVNFQRGKYDEASHQFGELLGQTKGVLQGRERRFAEYKHLLAGVMAGHDQPAQAFIAAHRDEKNPPLAYYYLNAALEERHGRAQKGGQWLTQADAKYPPAAKTVFTESFQNLGWTTAHTERLVAVVNDAVKPPPPAAGKPALNGTNAAPVDARHLAAPARSPDEAEAPKPAFRTGMDTPPPPAFRTTGPVAQDVNGQMPPVINASEPQTLVEDAADTRAGAVGPAVLGKPSTNRRSTPAPTASPSADSGASPAPAASPTASPDAAATPAAAGSPGATPAPAFVQKYEAAYVKYLEKDYQEARTLLDEADAIQPGQKSSADLRDLIFKAYYEGGYVSFRKGDYPTALEQLGNADAVKPNNPDSLNLRGLVLSRQRNYTQAEAAFRKASQLDPSFYAAKFNYAELPFNYKNYGVARTRFEELFSQTDPVKQPVEAEITQFKVFLTLLLEGKIDAARGFMDHFTFTGATPARYFCQAALDFYSGNMEKAQGWIDSAGKEFKPQLVSIFKESFYRIGWMTDVNGQSAFAAGGMGTPAPGASPAASAVVAMATPAESASPAAASPAAVLALNAATPRASVPAVSPPPAAAAVAGVTSAASSAAPASSAPPKPAVSVAAASAAPSPIKPPVAASMATPIPAAAPVVVKPAPAITLATATPVPAAVGAAPATAKATPTPEEETAPAADISSDSTSQVEHLIQVCLFGIIVIPTIVNVIFIRKAVARRQARMLARKGSTVYNGNQEELEPEEAQNPR